MRSLRIEMSLRDRTRNACLQAGN